MTVFLLCCPLKTLELSGLVSAHTYNVDVNSSHSTGENVALIGIMHPSLPGPCMGEACPRGIPDGMIHQQRRQVYLPHMQQYMESLVGRILSVDFLRSLRPVRMHNTPEHISLGEAQITISAPCFILQSGLMNPTCPETTEACNARQFNRATTP